MPSNAPVMMTVSSPCFGESSVIAGVNPGLKFMCQEVHNNFGTLTWHLVIRTGHLVNADSE